MKYTLALLVILASCTSSHVSSSRYNGPSEAKIFSLTNQERTSRGIEPLSYSTVLQDYARQHSAEMSRAGNVFHSSLPDDIVAENVGYIGAVPDWETKENDAFMASVDHRANILDSRLKVIGVGVVVAGGVAYVTEEYSLGEVSSGAPKPHIVCTPVVRTDCTYRLEEKKP